MGGAGTAKRRTVPPESFPVDFSREAHYNSGLCSGNRVAIPVRLAIQPDRMTLNKTGEPCVEEARKARFKGRFR